MVALGIAYMLYALACIALIVYAAIIASGSCNNSIYFCSTKFNSNPHPAFLDSFIFNLQGTCISFAARECLSGLQILPD